MDPLPLVVCATAAALYALGQRGKVRAWRELSFYSGVALAFIVLERPFDDWADTWLSAHMAQHIVLMTVVPPLVVLGRPWPRMWLPFPLRTRRAVGRGLSRSPSFRRSAGFLKRPAGAHRQSASGDLVHRGHGPELDPRHRARVRHRTGLRRVPVPDRPAARCGR